MKNLKVKVITICVLGLIGSSWAGSEIVTTYYGSPKGDYLSMKAKILQLNLTDNENYHVDDQQTVCENLGEGSIYVNSNNDIKVCPRSEDYSEASVWWGFKNNPTRAYIEPKTTMVGFGTLDPKYTVDLGEGSGKKLAIQSGASSFIGLGVSAPNKLSLYNGALAASPQAELSSNGDFFVLGNMTASDFTMSKGGRSFKFDATAASNVDTWIRFKNTTNPSAVTLGDMAVGQFWQEGNSYIAVNTGNVSIGKTTAGTAKLDVVGNVNIAGSSTVSSTAYNFKTSVYDKLDVGSNAAGKQNNKGQFVLPVYTNGQKPDCSDQVGCMWVQLN